MSSSSSSSASAAPRRVFIITGANTGVGFESARQIALRDDAASDRDDVTPRHVILACRTVSKGRDAAERITAMLPADSTSIVECMQLDVTDILSIDRFVAEIKRRKLPVNVLVNNAGVNAQSKCAQSSFNIDGIIMTNYLGPYYLTRSLLPIIRTSLPARIINVTSWMHRVGSTDFARYCRSPSRYSYSSSKLMQIYHAYDLARSLRFSDPQITVALTHPGACASDIWSHFEPKLLRNILVPISRAIMLTTEQGAASSVYAATGPVASIREGTSNDTEPCAHYGPYGMPSIAGAPFVFDLWQPSCLTRVTRSKTTPLSYDTTIASSLKALSDSLCEEWIAAAKD